VSVPVVAMIDWLVPVKRRCEALLATNPVHWILFLIYSERGT
jgi:hypothetical protein